MEGHWNAKGSKLLHRVAFPYESSPQCYNVRVHSDIVRPPVPVLATDPHILSCGQALFLRWIDSIVSMLGRTGGNHHRWSESFDFP